MAEIEESGTGRKKNFEPNLVPFIDLMSVLITFLLISAVWTQVSMIQIGTSIYGKKDPNQTEPVVPPENNVVLRLDIRATGYQLVVGRETFNLPLVNGEFDEASLIAQMERVKQLYPEKQDGILAMDDLLPYERLIRGMDAYLAAGFTNISILTGGPK